MNQKLKMITGQRPNIPTRTDVAAIRPLRPGRSASSFGA